MVAQMFESLIFARALLVSLMCVEISTFAAQPPSLSHAGAITESKESAVDTLSFPSSLALSSGDEARSEASPTFKNRG
jgi:hypothetical protein